MSIVVKMFTSRKKISKDKGAEPTEFEESVGQVIYYIPNDNYCCFCSCLLVSITEYEFEVFIV